MEYELARYDAYKDSGVEWLGEVPTHWKTMMIKNVYQCFGSGTTPDSSNPKYYGNGAINWLNTTDLKNCLVYETKRKITQLALTEKSLKTYPINTLAIAMYGQGDTRGNVGLLKIETTTNQAACMMYRSSNSIPKYILWWFVAKKTDIRKINVGATQPNMNQDFLRNLFISLPPLTEQKTIAYYLNTKTAQIDCKIALLTQKATQYGKLKQSLINETVTRGLDKTVAMKDSGVEWVGEVPEHWEVMRLKTIVNIRGRIGFRGYTTEDIVLEGEGAISLSPSNVFNNKLTLGKCTYLSWMKYEESPEIKIDYGDIIFVKTGSTIGKVALIDNIPEAMTINPQLVVFKKIKNHPTYLFYIMQSTSFYYEIVASTIGGATQALSQAKLGATNIVVPSMEEQQAIADYLDTKTAHIDYIVTTINTQIDKLKELRKTLINDVVTGKIKVP